MKHVIFSFLIALTFTSCHKGPGNFEAGQIATTDFEAVPIAKSPAPDKVEVSQRNPVENQKLIREGKIQFETKDFKTSRVLISDLCKQYESYVQNESNEHTDYQLSTDIVVRIPSARYDEYVAKLEQHAFRLTEKNIRVVDVTEEFIDVQARLKAKYELERRYLDLLKKAKNVEEMLSVEAQMSSVRYEIESMEGRMRSLKDRIAFSTLHVSFFQALEVPAAEQPTYLSKLTVAFTSGWDNLLSIFVGLVFLWPFIIFFTIGLFLALKRKRKQRTETQPTT